MGGGKLHGAPIASLLTRMVRARDRDGSARASGAANGSATGSVHGTGKLDPGRSVRWTLPDTVLATLVQQLTTSLADA